MPEIRKDPLLPRWVVMAPERARRPIQSFSPLAPSDNSHSDPAALNFDPFAEGNEDSTPPEVLAYRRPDSLPNQPGWRVRVVPNKFPALELHGELAPIHHGIYECMYGLGVHEVIIECPHGETSLARLSVVNIREVLSAYRDRMIELKQDRRLVHAIIFKNSGVLAGASLPHSHSQLIASPVVPIALAEEIEGARSFYDARQLSIFDEMLQQERASGARVILESDLFFVVCPYASRFPYEICLLPKRQQSHFENTAPAELHELAQVLQTVLIKLDLGLNNPPYNYVIHSAPLNEPELPWFRWHMEIFPRLTSVAGFEWGSGFYINPVFPEAAAEHLRSIRQRDSTSPS